MKKLIAIFFLSFIYACGDSVIEKPERLIDEDKMVNIFYDLALLEAVRTQKPLALRENNIDPHQYIYTKYKIDSLQFAQSNRYYASDIDNYKAMYERVGQRLKNNIEKIDPSTKKPVKSPLKTGRERK